MWNPFINFLDSIDKSLMLLLNYDGGLWQDCLWLAFSSRLLWILPAVALIYYLFKHYSRREAITILMALAVTIVLTDQISASLIKPFFGRLRPSHCAELSTQLHLVNGYRGGLYGFVSSHAANAFGAVSFVALLMRRRWLTATLLTLGLCVGYSRIYLGVHYPGDVLFGSMLGCGVGIAVYHIMRLSAKAYQKHIPQFIPTYFFTLFYKNS